MSEQGFYAPSTGYWQTNAQPTDATKAAYPSGTIEVPLRPSVDHQWQGGMWVYEAPPPAPPANLNKSQWSYLLDLTGFRTALDAALAALPKTSLQEKAVWAGMKAVAYESPDFSQAVTLVLAAQVRAMGIPGLQVPPDQEIKDAWPLAVAFQGAASIGVNL